MKSATIPSVRVEPEFRAEIEAALKEGETLSEFVEESVRENARRRRVQSEFIARGIRALEEAKATNNYVDSEVVVARLQSKLDAARKIVAERSAARLAASSK